MARTIVAGKIQNIVRLDRNLARLSKDLTTTNAIRDNVTSVAVSLADLKAAGTLDEVRGIEGHASRSSFDSVRRALLADLPFGSRTRRPPLDPVNAVLSFVYSLARTRAETACELVGLDPQVGYLHSLRPGRPALALDLMEELRPDIERLVLTLCNRRQLTDRHFEELAGRAQRLTEQGRRVVISAWYELLARPVRHRVLRQDYPWGLVPSIQATLLARHLRGDLDHYLPYVTQVE